MSVLEANIGAQLKRDVIREVERFLYGIQHLINIEGFGNYSDILCRQKTLYLKDDLRDRGTDDNGNGGCARMHFHFLKHLPANMCFAIGIVED